MATFWNRCLRRMAQPAPAPSPRTAPRPAAPSTLLRMEQALDLDLRTDWPTHRIRSFLSTQERSGR